MVPDPAFPSLPLPLADWFAARGWHPRRHQLEMLDVARAGCHGLIVATTGARMIGMAVRHQHAGPGSDGST